MVKSGGGGGGGGGKQGQQDHLPKNNPSLGADRQQQLPAELAKPVG